MCDSVITCIMILVSGVQIRMNQALGAGALRK